LKLETYYGKEGEMKKKEAVITICTSVEIPPNQRRVFRRVLEKKLESIPLLKGKLGIILINHDEREK
jgi:hypothetical protein